MNKTSQTKFGKEYGNCMEACLASMLDLSIEDIPGFGNDDAWWARMREWLYFREYSPLEIKWPIDQKLDAHIFPNDGQVCWAVGNSPRGDCRHAILVYWIDGDWAVYHDPHPDRTGLDGPIEAIGMLVPIWPRT